MPKNGNRPPAVATAGKPQSLDTQSIVSRSRLRKAELPVTPLAVSQLTSEALLGIPSRHFREWVRSRHLPHTRLGKLVVVDIGVALAELRRTVAAEDAQQPTTEVERIRAAAGIRVGAS